MVYTQEQLNDYKTGLTKGLVDAKEGVSEEKSKEGEYNEMILKGIHDGYLQVLEDVYDSMIKTYLKEPTSEALYKVKDARNQYLGSILDTGQTLETRDNKFYVMLDGAELYSVVREEDGLKCNCPHFHTHQDCAHISLVKDSIRKGDPVRSLKESKIHMLSDSVKFWECFQSKYPNNEAVNYILKKRREALSKAQ